MYSFRRRPIADFQGEEFSLGLSFWDRNRGQPYLLSAFLPTLSNSCGQMVNLCALDVSSEQPLDYRLDVLAEGYDLKQDGPRIGDYPDRGYIEQAIIPHYARARATGEPELATISTLVQGRFAIYERLILPFGAPGR